jgi:hypothetical protein
VPSLNVLQPENVAHGSDITIQAQLSSGAYVTLGEVYEFDYDIDQGVLPLPVLGSRRTGSRQGRVKITGSLKAYWINNAVRTLLAGDAPLLAGTSFQVYASQRPFQRYNISVSATISCPAVTLINVVFEKDAMKITENGFVEETINFTCEDVIGN